MNSSKDDSKTLESAAAAASSITVDQYYAQTLQALDQLTNIFSFPKDLAQKAIEECGPEDVQVSYCALHPYQYRDAHRIVFTKTYYVKLLLRHAIIGS
jgi:hypothetical protein